MGDRGNKVGRLSSGPVPLEYHAPAKRSWLRDWLPVRIWLPVLLSSVVVMLTAGLIVQARYTANRAAAIKAAQLAQQRATAQVQAALALYAQSQKPVPSPMTTQPTTERAER